MSKDEAVQKIISWGKMSKSVEALILNGSLASKTTIDKLSDIDITVFGTDFTFIQKNDEWLLNIGKAWLCIHDQFSFEEYSIPTRLTIFDGGLKIDFSFHPIQLLHALAAKKVLPDAYKNGYKVLLDKQSLSGKLARPDHKAFVLSKPGIIAFQNNENEFWFECYHVAKYLKRGDLWTAKVREQAVKIFLLEMLQWHHIARHGMNFNPKPYGRDMQNWLDPLLWNRLRDCYAGFDKANSWLALSKTISLYREIAKEAAKCFHFDYNKKPDRHLSSFIEQLNR